MLGKPFTHEERGLSILFLDFEGFQSSHGPAGDRSKSSRANLANSTDSKLFALGTLLSSTICFNIVKTFNEQTLEDLALVQQLERKIKLRPPGGSANLMRERGASTGRSTVEDQQYAEHLFPQLMPKMIYLVRDSQIDLSDKRGELQSENQWLELKLSEFAKSTKRKLTNIREELLKLFPDRELIRMRHPLQGCVEGDAGNLAVEDLGEEFKADLEYL